MKVQDYRKWIQTHRKYSHSPEFNLDRAGYQFMNEVDVDVVKCKNGKDRWENNQEICEVLSGVYKFDDWVCIRRIGGFGVPFVFIYAK